ncbi:MAG: hypothetical protein HQK68_06975 [Desulfamplus sp.]|nr:hypothetical protein [Desulfamplus sp.]
MTQMGEKYLLDRKFLEFWGNLLLNIAKGQEQLEQMSSLMNMDSMMKMDFMNLKEMSQIFRQVYGLPLDDSNANNSESNSSKGALSLGANTPLLNESFEAFQSSFARYITLWGLIPKRSYDEIKQNYESLQKSHSSLKRDYDSLRQKSDMQEELISQLRDILNEKGMGHIELFQHIQNLTRKQTGEFHNLIQNMQNLFKPESSDK